MTVARLFYLACSVAALVGCAGSPSRIATQDAAYSQPYDFGLSGADFGIAAATDMGQPGGCNHALECVNACLARSLDGMSPDACLKACDAAALPTGKVLLGTLFSCLETACPSRAMGDVCADRTTPACVTCYHDSQALPTGHCHAALAACLADLP